ncbi:MAG: hypothetical protein K8R48_06735 [Alphaproteobacteria bacterium]|nr:hypothetical protein [Alphaproteobacteria bacterium]
MSQVEFKAPGPGSWELEETHFSRPMTRYISGIFPEHFARGFSEGTTRYGLLLDYFCAKVVNDFCYMKAIAVGAPESATGLPPRFIFMLLARLHPAMRKRLSFGRDVLARKIWHDDMRRWDEEYKPDSIARNRKLQKMDIAALSDADFLAYLADIKANLGEMIYRHHIFTVPSCFAVGHFLAETQRWTGLTSGEVLGVLKGATPVSRGAGTLGRLQEALKSKGITAESVRGRDAQSVLDELKQKDGIAAPLQEFLEEIGYRAVSGYDISEKYALEMPEMLLGTMFSASDVTDREGDFIKRRDALRAKVPEAQRAQFDALLEEARFMYRLRDERGIYNDNWATGIARRAILEAGRRLAAKGLLPDAALAIDASHDEIIGMLTGSKEPGIAELVRRQTWRTTKTVADAPAWLGAAPSGPPPAEWLPKKSRAGARAMGAVIGNIFTAPDKRQTKDSSAPKSVTGLPVHPGVYEGIARIVNGPQDFNRLQQGDILVTRNTSAAFNVVLPLLGAIVTDGGGQLSHAAIVAREYGIPSVVGTRKATAVFADGARIRVDGDKGEVHLVEAVR